MIAKSGAAFSENQAYRYALWRLWDEARPLILFVGLNPSTADEKSDDPTLRRCVRFAQQWGYGGLLVGNLFAWRATNPRELMRASDPIGAENDDWLIWLGRTAGTTLLCWGNHGTHQARYQNVLSLLPSPCYHLGFTNQEQPRHPLYVPASTHPQLYIPPESAKLFFNNKLQKQQRMTNKQLSELATQKDKA